MPAKNKKQQRLFGMALALERGKMPKSKASKKVKEISKGMSEKEIEKFAKTKHKGLKENRALSFDSFLNEAYVDSEGRLQDFEFTPAERNRLDAFESVVRIGDFLKDAGAKNLRPELDEDTTIASFSFEYRGEPYLLELFLDSDTVSFHKTGIDETPIYGGAADDFFGLLAEKGFRYLL